MMQFDLRKYREAFCIWAAYRAAQAGSAQAKGQEFRAALLNGEVIEFLDNEANYGIGEQAFDKRHRVWVNAIIKLICDRYGKTVSYGVAAKFLAVFIKGYFILSGKHETSLAAVAHPPVDSYLLRGIDAENNTNLAERYNWQHLDESRYFELLAEIKTVNGKLPLWSIERYWKLP